MLIPENFDHLVIAVPDLAETVEQCDQILGVRPVFGGVHPRLGTANALLGLSVPELGDGGAGGDARADGDGGADAAVSHREIYLELLGPDPDQDPALAAARLGDITEPFVQRWAIHPQDFDGLVVAASGTLGDADQPAVDLGEVFDMSRLTPDGEKLEWRLTRRTPLALGGIQPFLIDWLDSPHPSAQAMPSVQLVEFWAESPRVDATRSILGFLGATIEVRAGDVESLHATLKGPGGSWTI